MATLGLRGLALVFTAGYSGSYLYNNQTTARDLADRLLRTAAASNNTTTNTASSSSTGTSAEISNLSAKLSALTEQVSRRSDSVLLIPPSSGVSSYKASLSALSDLLNLLGWTLATVTIGGVVFYIARHKNLSDFVWVSSSKFNATISSMQSGITRVTNAVSSVRSDLMTRLGVLKGQVQDVRASLGRQIEEEVGLVKEGVAEVGEEVADVKHVLGGVSSRIDELDSKIEFASAGIMALIKAVSSIQMENGGRGFQELKRFADVNGIADEGGRPRRMSTGLKGLLGGVTGGGNGKVNANANANANASAKAKVNVKAGSSMDSINAWPLT